MQRGTYSLHKNTQNCMSFFRSSRFFLSSSFFYLTKNRSCFFFYLFHLCRCRQKESRYSTQCLDNNVICLYIYICVPFPGNVNVVPPTLLLVHSIIYRFTCFSIHVCTKRTRLSVCLLKLDYIMFQKKEREKKESGR